jgi:hypothetical protein
MISRESGPAEDARAANQMAHLSDLERFERRRFDRGTVNAIIFVVLSILFILSCLAGLVHHNWFDRRNRIHRRIQNEAKP